MRRRKAVAIGIIAGASLWFGANPSAQPGVSEGVMTSAAFVSGGVQGLVRDAAGKGLADASVLAVGQTILSARSDVRGRFLLSLPPGDYILKASRSGYVSNYREPVRVQSSALLERTITLTKLDEPAADRATDDGHAHTELAWRLRHLSRSVLRDGADAIPGTPGPIGASTVGAKPDVASPLAAAFAGADFRGQLNFVTTTVARPVSEWSQGSWPRGVAYVSLGAPVVGYGAWQVRAAVASGDGASWNMLGEYTSDAARPHVWHLRLSYSAQGYTTQIEQLPIAVAEARSVAGIAGDDHWKVSPRLDIDYGARADRFDYLADPQLLSAHGGFTARLLPGTFVSASGARSMVAPGADEFLPPAGGGPWLPAEQMFVPLFGPGTLAAEEVRHAEVVLTHQFAPGSRAPAVRVRRFWQQSTDQMATLFGDASRGQYAVGSVGSVDLAGWGVGVSGQLSRYLSGQIEYARVTSNWQAADQGRAIALAVPAALRAPIERLQDLTATIDADLPRTATHVSVVYRASNAFSAHGSAGTLLPGSRFDLQVRQALPYQPTRNGHLELLFSVRNLFRDVRGEASWYDELLTVGPPVRLMGGIQLRF